MIFLADAHLNNNREVFLDFLKAVDTQEIEAKKIFFMGDMFDFLAYEIKYSRVFYAKAIELINKIAKTREIFFFEGNHDFNLKKIFPKLKVIPIQNQPYLYKDMLLSHGDVYESFSYKLFHMIVRNSYILKIINLFDKIFNNKISKKFLLKQQKKSICKNIPDFSKKIKQKIHLYDIESSEVNFILEGHYHQGESFKVKNVEYFNLKSFACDRVYYRYNDKGILQSKVF